MTEFDKLLVGTVSAARVKRKYKAATLGAERVQEESKTGSLKAHGEGHHCQAAACSQILPLISTLITLLLR